MIFHLNINLLFLRNVLMQQKNHIQQNGKLNEVGATFSLARDNNRLRR